MWAPHSPPDRTVNGLAVTVPAAPRVAQSTLSVPPRAARLVIKLKLGHQRCSNGSTWRRVVSRPWCVDPRRERLSRARVKSAVPDRRKEGRYIGRSPFRDGLRYNQKAVDSGAQTERRGEAGPVSVLLLGWDSPADFIYPLLLFLDLKQLLRLPLEAAEFIVILGVITEPSFGSPTWPSHPGTIPMRAPACQKSVPDTFLTRFCLRPAVRRHCRLE